MGGLIPVRLEDGLVVMHSRAEWERFMRGVDVEACEGMAADIDELLANEDPD